jgi:membrane-associated phospholipid phosphatase
LADDGKVRRTSLLALESLVISGALTEGLKRLSGRPRPETGEAPDNWHGPGSDSRYVSFTSGHTSNAFAVATVIANEYKDVPYVATTAYGLATLTALSRIYSNKHWASDTLLGAAIGHFVSKAVLDYHKEDKKPLSNRLSLSPQVGKEMTGLTVNYKF